MRVKCQCVVPQLLGLFLDCFVLIISEGFFIPNCELHALQTCSFLAAACVMC